MNGGFPEARETKSLISFAAKTKDVQRLIIVTNEEERTITIDVKVKMRRQGDRLCQNHLSK